MPSLARLGPLALAFAVHLSVWAPARPAAASVEDVIGFGPRTAALAGAGAALGEGFETTYLNPALLSTARARELTVGFVGANFDLRVSGERLDYEALRGFVIGGVLPLPFGAALKDRLAFGFGFFVPVGILARARILYPETPQFPVGDRTQSVTLRAGLGADLGHGLRVGAGVGVLAGLEGGVVVGSDASGRIGTVLENALVANYAPVLGASYDLGKDYRVGLTFRGELAGSVRVGVLVEDLDPLTLPTVNIGGIVQYDPPQLALELARTSGPLRGAVGAVYRHWPAYPGPVEATVFCPEVDPQTGEAPTCDLLEPEPLDYAPTLSPRLAVEGILTPRRGVTMRVRGGYAFEASPAPPQSGRNNLYDNARSVLAAGYGLDLDAPLPPVRLDLFAQLQLLHPRDHEKAEGAVVETGGVILAGGLAGGLRF